MFVHATSPKRGAKRSIASGIAFAAFAAALDAEIPTASIAAVDAAPYPAVTLRSRGIVSASPLLAQGASERVLHSFHNNGTDGSQPVADLIDVNGVLYSTTTRTASSMARRVSVGNMTTEPSLN